MTNTRCSPWTSFGDVSILDDVDNYDLVRGGEKADLTNIQDQTQPI